MNEIMAKEIMKRKSQAIRLSACLHIAPAIFLDKLKTENSFFVGNKIYEYKSFVVYAQLISPLLCFFCMDSVDYLVRTLNLLSARSQ